MIRIGDQCRWRSVVAKSFSAVPTRWAGTKQAAAQRCFVRRSIRGRHHLTKHEQCGRGSRLFATETERKGSDKDTTIQPGRNGRTASFLLQNLVTQLRSPPNVITMLRMLSAPYLSHLVVTERYEFALYGCMAAGFSDVLDGYLARKYHMSTVLGTYLDPLADKVIINVLAVSLWHNDILPAPLVALWLLRDLALMGGTYIYVRSNTRQGNWVVDPITTPLKVEPTNISKINTGLQFLTVSIGLLQPTHSFLAPEVLLSLWCVMCFYVLFHSKFHFINTLTQYDCPLQHYSWLTGGTAIASMFSYGSMSAFTKSGNVAIATRDSFIISHRMKEEPKALLQSTKDKSMKNCPQIKIR
jgi:phosphatidylglycerophosphate synthase